VQQLVQNARQFGMNLPNPAGYEELNSTEGEFVRQKMNYYKSKNVQYILFFTKDKQDPVHNTMKLLEVEFSIPTQHISSQTIQKVQTGRGAQLVFGNILQKMNLKLGGINHDIVTAQAFQIRNNRRDNIVKDSWLKQTRMFIGIDMSHAGPQSLFERQAQIPSSEPTIVGMAYTVGHPVNIRGTYWCQKPRLTIIENLADKVSTAILNFHSQTNGFPTHLIVYRSGISEGEYAKVITQEESYFKEAFELVAKSNPSFRKPTLTIIVVQRNSNYRVVPQHIEERAPAVKQNCPSGTVVDREVMHPTQTEFLLTAQKAIQGTAHPCKCTVVFDDSAQRISLEELEYVTYALCFGHGIVTSPVSVPAPLYSAGDLAKRGRNNWKEHNFGNDSASVISGESGGRFRNAAGDPDFFINLSEILKPSINNTKFWA
jgi:eukaryotic translation initiation factor 2C